jgi:hypothetical protein
MAFFLLGAFSCSDGEENVVETKTITGASGTLFYYQDYNMFGIRSLQSADDDKTDKGIIDGGFIYLIKGFEEEHPEDVSKDVTFSGKYYPSDIFYPVVGYTVFYITDIVLNYK